MVGNNLDMHVLSTLARSAYAKSPSQPIFSVLISYFSGTLYAPPRKVLPINDLFTVYAYDLVHLYGCCAEIFIQVLLYR